METSVDLGEHPEKSGWEAQVMVSKASQDESWPICPSFLKLGTCQWLLHQSELGLDSSCGRKVQRAGQEHPPTVKPARQQEGVSIRACCVIFLCYLAGDFCRTALGLGAGGRCREAGWQAGAPLT